MQKWPIATVPEDARAPVAAWLDLLTTWNARMDLTAARSDEELVDLMLADAAVLAPHVPVGATLVDVGSGAGAPGFALALLRPDLRVTLVEPLGKRAAFLRAALGTTGRTDVTIARARGEELVARGEEFDVAVSRATLAPQAWLELGAKLASSVWVLLAKEDPPSPPPPAHEGAAWRLADDLRYEWPLTTAPRRALRYVSAAAGPSPIG